MKFRRQIAPIRRAAFFCALGAQRAKRAERRVHKRSCKKGVARGRSPLAVLGGFLGGLRPPGSIRGSGGGTPPALAPARGLNLLPTEAMSASIILQFFRFASTTSSLCFPNQTFTKSLY